MANQKNDNTKSSANKKTYKNRKKKSGSIFAKLLIFMLVIGGISFCATTFLGNIINSGEQIDEDIRTAEELQDKVVNILVAGIDFTEGRDFGNTDVMMYVTLDVENKTISALQLPRDTYVGTDIGAGPARKMNGIYGHGKDKNNKIMNLVKAVNNQLDLPVDHYVTLDMDALIEMVDWIDWGFEMYVPYPVILKDDKGNTQTLYEEPGWYQMTGERVEAVVRNRNYPGGDVQRLEVQNYFYASLVKNFTENLNVSDFIKVMSRFTQYLTTDLHWTKIASLAQFAFSVDYNDMTLIKPGHHGYDVIYAGGNSRYNILIADKNEWVPVINEYFRPYQDPVEASDLDIPWVLPEGEVVKDWGYVATTKKTIGDILSATQQ